MYLAVFAIAASSIGVFQIGPGGSGRESATFAIGPPTGGGAAARSPVSNASPATSETRARRDKRRKAGGRIVARFRRERTSGLPHWQNRPAWIAPATRS